MKNCAGEALANSDDENVVFMRTRFAAPKKDETKQNSPVLIYASGQRKHSVTYANRKNIPTALTHFCARNLNESSIFRGKAASLSHYFRFLLRLSDHISLRIRSRSNLVTYVLHCNGNLVIPV